jgi:dihydroorotase
MDRRQFLRVTAAGAPALLASPAALFAQEFDLVIRGGRVIDPAQGLDRVADVGISAGQIAAIRPAIPASSAAKSIDATGKLVVPGLIDIHLHARDAELPPAKILETGVT